MSQYDGNFGKDWDFQARFLPHQKEIAPKAIRVDVAPVEEDLRRNTDLVLQSVAPVIRGEPIRISARVRRREHAGRYADEFTIRARRPAGVRTEWDKLRAGDGDYFIYGFESETGSDRMHPWFIGNLHILRDYITRGGYGKPERNRGAYGSKFIAYHLADMPPGFIVDSEGLGTWDSSRIWEQCRRCWWGRDKGGYVIATDEHREPATGYGRRCLACGFWWRAGWEMRG